MKTVLAIMLLVTVAVSISCSSEPTREFPDATDEELDRACQVLSLVNFKYESMSDPWRPIAPRRVVEVAAMIDWKYPGPDNTRGYCRRLAYDGSKR